MYNTLLMYIKIQITDYILFTDQGSILNPLFVSDMGGRGGRWEERRSLTYLYFVLKLKTLKTATAVKFLLYFLCTFFVLETS